MMTLSERAELAIRLVREHPLIAFDVETSGLDWKRHNPVGYVVTASAEQNVYIPVRHGGGSNLADPHCGPLTAPDAPTTRHAFERELANAFAHRSQQTGFLTVGHNLKFDCHAAANQGILLGRNLEDTSVNEPMLDEHQFSYSLDACAERRGVTPKKGQVLYEHMSRLLGIPLGRTPAAIMEHYWRLPGDDEIAVEYALGDGITTLELRAAQYPLLIEEDEQGYSMRFIHGVECELIWTLFRMERKGIKVDVEYVDKLISAIGEELALAKAVLPDGFNERSGPQTQAVMEAAGVVNWPKTPNGNPSFNEKFLLQSEQGRAIVAIRKLSNLLSKFAYPLRDVHVFKGRVHTNLNQLRSDEGGTISGRLSCSDPNLQAVTKRDKVLGPRFRKCFVADDGMDIEEKDWSQAEPRLIASYSKDENLLSGYNAVPFRDVHSIVADMLGVERDPTAKRMNMGILTGMQSKTFAGHMGWPLDRAAAAHRAWFDLFPGVRKFQNGAKQALLQRGYVRTLCGRRCRLDSPQFAYKGTSKIIQGGQADMMKYKLVQLDKFFESIGDELAQLLLSIHDSVIFQMVQGAAGDEISARVNEILIDVQGPPFSLRVPFVAEGHRGKSWADATYGVAA